MRLIACLIVFLSCCKVGSAQVSDSMLKVARQKEKGRLIMVDNRYRLWVQQAGKGKTKLLILPGGPGGSHYGYEPFTHFLPPDNVQVYILDMVDCGLSDRTQNTAYWSMSNYVHDIEAIRLALGLEHFYLLGHSFGGMIAFEYAAAHPDRLQGLLISNMTDSWQGVRGNAMLFIDSLAKQNPFAQQLKREAEEADSSSYAFQRISYQLDSLTRVLFDRATAPDQSTILPVFKAVSDTLLSQNVAVFKYFYGAEEFQLWDFQPKLAQLPMPVLLLGGGRDYALRWADMIRIKKNLHHGSLAYCAEGSHLMFWSSYMYLPEIA